MLIAAMLTKSQFSQLLGFAESLGLDALCEAHTPDEIEMLLSGGAKIVGVNCRNLKNFETDFGSVAELIKLVPSDKIRVSESAIGSRAELLKAGGFGADGALVGSVIMRAASPEAKVRELLGKQ